MSTTAGEAGLPCGIIWCCWCWNRSPGDAFNERRAKYCGKKILVESQDMHSKLWVLLLQEEMNNRMPSLRNCHLVSSGFLFDLYFQSFAFNPHLSEQVLALLILDGISGEGDFQQDHVFNLFTERWVQASSGRLNSWWEWISDLSDANL